jgi:subtilisin family serine protease
MLATLAAHAQIETTGNGRRVEGELLVKFRAGSRGTAAVRSKASFHHEVRRQFDHVGWQQIRLPRGLTIEEALAHYRNSADVLAAEPNLAGQAVEGLPEFSAASTLAAPASGTPNDPQFPNQWALARVEAPIAWLNQIGSTNVVVAVIDSGVNYLHEDLRDNLWRNPDEVAGNGIDDDGNGWVDDVFGIDTANDSRGNDSDPFDQGLNGYYHGSLVAGVIGAVSNNGLGVAGVNWSVRIMAVRAIRASNLITVGDELNAIEYVLAMKNRGVNIRAVNMSYGGIPYSTAERDALAALQNAGILLCISAGNSGRNNDTTPIYPASHPLPGIIAVAASDLSDRLATFPSGGTSHYGRTSVDLAAPGLGIASTFGPGTNAYLPDFFGTSAAAPHVTGAAALLAAANPAATPQQIKSALLESVDLEPAFTNKMVSHGRLNLGRAIDHPLIANGPPMIARHPLAQSAALGGSATFTAIVFGEKPRTFQWFFNDAPIPGATNVTLTLTDVPLTRDGLYSVAVSNRLGGMVSEPARLTVLVNPVITSPPISQSVAPGGSVTFSAGFTGNPPLFGVEWRQGSVVPASNTVAAFQDFFLLTNAQPAHAGTWRVRVRNLANSGGVERLFNLAVLPDRDGDGLPNDWELAHGLCTNDAADAVFDADLDGVANRDEYTAGTNPTNAQSVLKIETIRRTDAATALTFQAVSNKTYTVEARAGEIEDRWQRIADLLPATTNRTVSVLDGNSSSDAARYYRLVTPRRP